MYSCDPLTLMAWETAKLTALADMPGVELGQAVAVERDRVVAGAPGYPASTEVPGSAIVFASSSWTQYGEGWPGTFGIPRLTVGYPPLAGGYTVFEFGNSLEEMTVGFLIFGLVEFELPTGLGGSLYTIPATILSIVLPPQGVVLPAQVPPELSRIPFYLQLLVQDPGASGGIAFSPAVRTHPTTF